MKEKENIPSNKAVYAIARPKGVESGKADRTEDEADKGVVRVKNWRIAVGPAVRFYIQESRVIGVVCCQGYCSRAYLVCQLDTDRNLGNVKSKPIRNWDLLPEILHLLHRRRHKMKSKIVVRVLPSPSELENSLVNFSLSRQKRQVTHETRQ